MKVVRIIARLNVGGPARHVAWLSAGLRRAGIESVLVAGTVPPGEDDMIYFAARLGVEPLIIQEMSREVSPKDAVTVWKLYRLFRRERPDLVHTHTAKAGTVGRVAGFLYRWLTPAALLGRPRPCRFVHTYHGHIFHSYYGRWKTLVFLVIERVLARLCTDRIVVISPQQYREIHEQFNVGRREQFAVVPLGLDTSGFSEHEARRREERRRTEVADADLLVGIVGRLTEIKNHTLFLEAAARYKKDRAMRAGEGARRVRFLIIGDGHLRGELEEQARSLGIAGDVEFTGMRDDPENFYPALDVAALTSLNEGTPLTLIEAMANARPVIATAVGGVVDLLGDVDAGDANAGDTAGATQNSGAWEIRERGVLVKTHNAEDFARALAHLLEREELRGRMGVRAQEFIERNYSVERLIADVAKLYEELLDPAGHVSAGAARDISRSPVGTARLKGE